MTQPLTVIGAPSGAGACGVGQEQAPAALRAAGLIESLGDVKHNGFLVKIEGADRELVLRAARALRPIPAGVR